MTAAGPRTSAPAIADPVDRSAAEEASVFGHQPVPPDATAAYGDHPDQVIDFYRPRIAGDRPAPLVALLHGGAWRAAYDRAHVSPLAAHLAAHGFAVASLGYRRGGSPQTAQGPSQSPEATLPPPADPTTDVINDPGESPGAGGPHPPAGRWPDTFDDVAAALDGLPELAVQALDADTVDPCRTVITGHSAGGHLALWAAARHVLPPDSPWHRSSPPPFRGVVALAPIADFASSIRLGVCSGAVLELLGGTSHVTVRIPHADPAVLLPTGIATTIVHGTTDNVVPPQVSDEFAKAATAAGEPPTVAWLAATGHFPLIDPANPAVVTVINEIGQLIW
ncbi:alpha/beta hydrolase family protein [Streptomyces sp. NBC_01190]|uniref:alpha/beta hydrolase family protein n=1 Tax=Streptomyces sp. NBC_01190 TaxID=2903767 RepID=UPI0038690EF4|nr:alpha/beta hydrolase [Streptomyces sp. NBC_01190]